MYLGVCAMHYNYLSVKNKCDELQTALDIKSDYIKVLETTIDTKTKEENERLKVEQQVVDFYIGHIDRVNNPPSVENVMAIESDSKKKTKKMTRKTQVQILKKMSLLKLCLNLKSI